MQANGFVANRKDAATQVEADTVESQSVSDARKARKNLLQSAQNLSFVRLLPFFDVISHEIVFSLRVLFSSEFYTLLAR